MISTTPDIERSYLRDVGKRLRGLAPGQRDAVLDDLRAHFAEATEAGRTPEQAAKSLGSPEHFTGRILAELDDDRAEARRPRPSVVLVALLVAALAIGAVSGYLAVGAVAGSTKATQLADAVGVLEVQDDLMTALAQERALVVTASGPCTTAPCAAELARTALLRGVPGTDDGKPLRQGGATVRRAPSAQARTTALLAERDELVTDLDMSALPKEVTSAFDQVVYDGVDIQAVQKHVAKGGMAPQTVTKAYDLFLADSADVSHQLSRATDDRGLADHLAAHQAANEVLLAGAVDRSLIPVVIATGAAGSGHVEAVEQISTGNDLFGAADRALDQLPGELQMPAPDGAFGTVRDLTLQGDLAGATPELQEQFVAESRQWTEEARAVRDSLRAGAVDRAESNATAAQAKLLTAAASTGVALLAALVLGVAVVVQAARRRS
ncbi:DUF1700 domain-containing protein [Myceligenerans crystallogenes]|uniref:DUF1707 domain-containing protein n=1 Tax=Myceligenerans crystallogenes TaxID=316335 RepID=A0ABP4ZZT4_9MICO